MTKGQKKITFEQEAELRKTIEDLGGRDMTISKKKLIELVTAVHPQHHNSVIPGVLRKMGLYKGRLHGNEGIKRPGMGFSRELTSTKVVRIGDYVCQLRRRDQRLISVEEAETFRLTASSALELAKSL